MPEFAYRPCADCRLYLYGSNGVRSEDDATGEPHKLADYGESPPCGRCPKLGPADPKAPLEGDADLYAGDWFWDVQAWFRECRAVGDFGRPDPFMRSVFAELDRAERAADRRAMQDGLRAAVRDALGR